MKDIIISSRDISMSSSVRALLTHLDGLLSGKGDLYIDVGGTDLEFIIDRRCVHCYAKTPVYKPKHSAFIGYYCQKCDFNSPCPHATDLDEPEVTSVTRYTLRLSDSVIGRSLEYLGFSYGQPFQVTDGEGRSCNAVIKEVMDNE